MAVPVGAANGARPVSWIGCALATPISRPWTGQSRHWPIRAVVTMAMT